MTRILFVGDVHGKVEDLEDCERLRAFVLGIVEREQPDAVVFLGDQYDNHAIKHVEVERFWMNFFAQLSERKAGIVIYALVGNHDRPGNASVRSHAMQVHKDVVVVDRPTVGYGSILFVPYYHDPAELVKAARVSDLRTLVCHAAFAGGHYDNGVAIKADAFYGKDVVNPDDLPQRTIISGHIHAPAKFGKVWYPGSPRWLTMGDANVSRAVHLVELSTDRFVSEKTFSTDKHLRRTWQLDYTPEDRCENELPLVASRDKVLVNIRGPLVFCEESRRMMAGRGFRARVFPTDRGVVKVSEAEGIPKAFDKHFLDYKPKYGTSKKVLRELLQERLHV